MAEKPTQSLPVPSVQAFAGNLIDYAGLLPPVSLPMEKAFDNYMSYREGEYKWMLSSFVCPIEILPKLTNLLNDKYKDEDGVKITVLGREGNTEKEFVSKLTEDIVHWKDFAESYKGKVITDSLICKLPVEVIKTHDVKTLSSIILLISKLVSDNIPNSVKIFLEGVMTNKWKRNVKIVIDAIKTHNLTFNDMNYALRIGDASASEIPEPKQIVFIIRECLKREIVMKITGGMQYPVRQFSESLQTKLHGFMNVFGSGIIAMRHNISNRGLVELLRNEKADKFTFTDECFSWHEWEINIKDIEYARKYLMTSMISCYFVEAVEGLKAKGML